MKTYRIVAKSELVIFGKTVPSGSVLGVLATDHPTANVLSAGVYGLAAVEPDGQETIDAAPEIAHIITDPVGTYVVGEPITDPVAAAAEVDRLNAEPETEFEDSEAAAGVAVRRPDTPAEEPEPITDSVAAAPELEGLTPRVAAALTAAELTTREAIAAFVEQGGDLTQFEGIGTAAAKKIVNWLEVSPANA